MGWSPVGVGDGRTSHHAFTTDSAIFSLSGILNNAIALHMEDVNTGNTLYICTGTWNITNGTSGTADFTPSAADLSTGPFSRASVYKAYPVVTLSTGPVPMDSQLVQVVSEP